jgi:hypothetical protein
MKIKPLAEITSTASLSLNFKLFTCVILSSLIFLHVSFAQSVISSVNGTLKDEKGSVVSGATVTLVDLATNRTVTTTTNDDGYFTFPDVRAGNYNLTAERQGFKKASVGGIKVDVGVPTTINLTLPVGGVTEAIDVTAAEAQNVVNLENAELSATVFQRQINDLPLNGRNPLDLAGLQAGVNTSGELNRDASINGLRGTTSNLTWDGININDNFIRTDSLFAGAAPSVPGVSEFTIVTQNSNPSDGLGVSQVKLITPRGQKEFHGSLFEYHRNDALDANSFFNNAAGVPKEKLIQNQFGVAIGGPFVLPRFGEGGPTTFGKDKLFFYGYYEGTRIAQGSSVLRTVLTQPARQGLFTYRRLDNGQLQTVNLLSISRRSLDPTVANIISTTPQPNDLTNADIGSNPSLSNVAGFRYNTPLNEDYDLFGGRLDFDISDHHRVDAEFSYFDYLLPNSGEEPFPGTPGNGQSSKRPRFSIAWNWSITPHINNEIRAGLFSTNAKFFTNESFDEGYRLTFPLITDPIDTFLPQGRRTDNYDIMDNAIYTVGNHQIRFGGNYRLVNVNPYNEAGTIPLYTVGFNTTTNPNPLSTALFPGGLSSNDFSRASDILSILTGAVGQVDQTFYPTSRTSGFVSGASDRQYFQYFNIGLYGQDSWRVRPNLTLNFGLRYEFISVPKERRGLALLPRGGLESLRDPNAMLDFASGGGRPFFNNDLNNFAPNISLAWDPFGEGKTSVRAGYAISYIIDNNISTLLNLIRGNDGLVAEVTRNISGTVSQGGISPVTPPQFRVPRSIADNLAISPTTAIFHINPDFRTPYVQQWTLSVEREILPNTLAEIRYVGNRGTKLTRAIDINQVRIFDNGFLADFQRAQRNLARFGDPYDPRGERLQIFPRLGFEGALDDPGFQTFLRNGEVGQLAALYAGQFREFFFSPSFGASLTPGYFLRTNPNAFVVDYYDNLSYSNYHALQAEIRRRFSDGLSFQANYTYSKAIADFDGSQSNFLPLLDLGAGFGKEKMRISDDITHVFKANALWDLPIGKRFLNYDGVLGKVFSGWTLGGIMRLQSGEPISIISNRGTVNRSSTAPTSRSIKNTVNTSLSVKELQDRTGIYYDAQGRPVLFHPSLIGPDGRANPQYFQNPTAGTLGSLQMTPVSGPKYFSVDMGLIKRTSISENVNIEFRAEAFNVFNRTNFNLLEPDDAITQQYQNINSTTFGRLTDTHDPRILQFALKLNF